MLHHDGMLFSTYDIDNSQKNVVHLSRGVVVLSLPHFKSKRGVRKHKLWPRDQLVSLEVVTANTAISHIYAGTAVSHT